MTNVEIIQIFLKRFARAFLAGAVSFLSVQLTQIPISDFGKKEVLLTLLVGAIAGGLMGVEKLLRIEM